ncbi:MAG: hypothetical protein J0L62_03020 [Bacteroidetes bacterium]|nr:hypothetical protein [Bacteroidota bacterium]
MIQLSSNAILIGFIQIVIAYPSFSYSQHTERSLEAGCEAIATQLSGKLQTKSLKLAVLEVSDYSNDESNNNTTELGRILADELVNSLSNHLTIQELYDRKFTQKRLQELGKGSDDLYDPAFAKQFGKSIGVDALIIGTYNIKQVSKTCRIIIKVIEVETGRITATSNTEFFIDDENLSKAGLVSNNKLIKNRQGYEGEWFIVKVETNLEIDTEKDLNGKLAISFAENKVYLRSYFDNRNSVPYLTHEADEKYTDSGQLLLQIKRNNATSIIYLSLLNSETLLYNTSTSSQGKDVFVKMTLSRKKAENQTISEQSSGFRKGFAFAKIQFADEKATMMINGKEAVIAEWDGNNDFYKGHSDWIDVSHLLKNGKNDVRMIVDDLTCCESKGHFLLKVNGVDKIDRTFTGNKKTGNSFNVTQQIVIE